MLLFYTFASTPIHNRDGMYIVCVHLEGEGYRSKHDRCVRINADVFFGLFFFKDELD